MKSVYRGLVVAIAQCALVLSVAGKYALDRERLPRVWTKVAPVDPNLPVRGRYLSLRVQVEAPALAGQVIPARLSAAAGKLVATPDRQGSVHIVSSATTPTLAQPLAFFLAEHASDPSHLGPDEELWVEVSVPARGSPRPIRLGVKKAGVLQPLELR